MSLFKWLCAETEPTAFEVYVSANRGVRGKMLSQALDRYAHRLFAAEIAEIREAMKALDRLAKVRNQIAHGHVSKMSMTYGKEKVMDGHYLVPSLNEAGHQIVRDPRYAHTATEIDAWRDEVRHERGRIMDATLAPQLREQEQIKKQGGDAFMNLTIAKAIVERRIQPGSYTMTPKQSVVNESDDG